MWFEWMSPWWRDTINVAVAVATVLATAAGATAIGISLSEASKSRDRLRKERRRLHDLEILTDLLRHMIDRPGHNAGWSWAKILQRMLSPDAQALVPNVVKWSHQDARALADELRPLHPENASRELDQVGLMRVDDARNLYDVIFDELVEATHHRADSADD